MKTLSIDIETYSDQPLAKTGVYRYVESPVFEILLFSYSADGGPVQLVDLACGEKIPTDILAALEDDSVTKWAFNASFERICLSRYLGYPTGEYLAPDSWKCSMVWAATMGLPLSLEGVGAVLGLEKQKLTEGKELIWEFDKPKKNGDHPTMKPIPLLAYPIMNSSMSNAMVLDPFGGSGSTLIACEQTDRICRTIELDEKFCDVIVKRYIEQVGSADGVSVQRDGLTYRYDEVAAESSMT